MISRVNPEIMGALAHAPAPPCPWPFEFVQFQTEIKSCKPLFLSLLAPELKTNLDVKVLTTWSRRDSNIQSSRSSTPRNAATVLTKFA
jgi:hypothetical protein